MSLPLVDLAEQPETRTSRKADGYRERVAAVFHAKPNRWLPARCFFKVGGQCGWRTRISQCRRELKMNILPGKTVSVRAADGRMKYRLSFYKFVPAEETR